MQRQRCPKTVSHNSGKSILKLPSHLAKSRHGVFYFRLTFRVGAATKEKRISLRTKNSQEARFKAMCLSGIMAAQTHKKEQAMATNYLNTATSIAQGLDSDFLLNLLHRVNREQLAELSGLPQQEIEAFFTLPTPDSRNLDIDVGGISLRNINNDDDATRAIHILKSLNLSQESLAQLIASPTAQAQQAIPAEDGGTTIQEMIPRFATRKKAKLSEKTLYEYGNYHRKFVAWLELRKKKKHITVHSITRADLADFIDDLLASGIAPKTVTQKYLAAISGLFELAQSIGVIPEGQILVSRGHKVFTKQDAKKSASTSSYKPFTDTELKSIFQSDLLTKAKQPADFWLPMLGLFTGGRVSELSQIDIADIQKHGEVWALSINNDGDKSLKTLASTRLIPLHPTLIDCGFLEYVNDASQHGKKLFPYLAPDKFGSYGGRTSERWGSYLDTLGIKDSQKTFHSFRSTSNNRLKHNGVPEENRCQFIGHEHDTIISATYSEPHKLPFLLENVASKLDYPGINFSILKYKKGQFNNLLEKECSATAKRKTHLKAKAERLIRLKK